MKIKFILNLLLIFISGCAGNIHQSYTINEIASNRANLIKLHTPKPINWGVITDAYNEGSIIVVIIESSETDHIKILRSKDEILEKICSSDEVLNIIRKGISYKFIVNHTNKKSIFSLNECYTTALAAPLIIRS